MDVIERKYALTKVAAGDYLLPSNDAQAIYRIRRYTDGPGCELWSVARWTGEVSPGNFVDTAPDSEQWETMTTSFSTRREAIEHATSLAP